MTPFQQLMSRVMAQYQISEHVPLVRNNYQGRTITNDGVVEKSRAHMALLVLRASPQSTFSPAKMAQIVGCGRGSVNTPMRKLVDLELAYRASKGNYGLA
jgi:hypothetical protein